MKENDEKKGECKGTTGWRGKRMFILLALASLGVFAGTGVSSGTRGGQARESRPAEPCERRQRHQKEMEETLTKLDEFNAVLLEISQVKKKKP